jgi:hypothetical protein
MDAKILENLILARLEEKSSHDYQWPRWSAAYEAYEASQAAIKVVQKQQQYIIDMLLEERDKLEGEGEFAETFRSGMNYSIGLIRGLR